MYSRTVVTSRLSLAVLLPILGSLQEMSAEPGSSATGGAVDLVPELVPQLDTLVSYRISLVAKMLERRLSRMLNERFGLTVAEYRVLGQVVMRPQSTISSIATITFVDKAQVSRSVASLEQQMLVSRSVSPSDRRSPELTATRSGQMLIRAIAPLRYAEEDEIFNGASLNATDIAGFTDTLEKLFAALVELGEAPARLTRAQRRNAIRRARAADFDP
jgi:DNA-binding MarR family transcriptional regulator